MTETETDAEFLKRVASSKWKLVDSTVELSTSSFTRLLRLAERGAKIPDEPTAHMSIAIHDAVEAATGHMYHIAIGDRIYRAITTALKGTDND